MQTSEENRKSIVSSYFGEHAESWKRRYNANGFDAWEYQTRGAIALQWLDELCKPHARLLEIGCGAGHQSSAAARRGWDVVAVDFAVGMLQEARQYSDRPTWIASVVEALPFKPNSYDVVLMNGVIGYVEDPMQTLRVVHDQLKPNGRYIVSWASPHPLFFESVSHAVSVVPDALYLSLKRLITRQRVEQSNESTGFYDQFLRRWTPAEFYQMLDEAGFRIERVRSQNFGQFRFMDHAVWPEQTDIVLSELLDRFAGLTPQRRLRDGARTHIALVSRKGD